VVQAVVYRQEVGADGAASLLDLAGCLLQAAQEEAAALFATTSNSSSSGCGAGGSSSSVGAWSLAASLAAATAAGAYTAYLGSESAGGAGVEAGSSCVQADVTASSSTGFPAAAPSCSTPAGASHRWAGCGTCCCASQQFTSLRCLEKGVTLSAPLSTAGLAVLADAAEQQGTTLPPHLQQQLLALAWRHPVPLVCGNVLCGRLEGPAAAGAVSIRRRTLCGGCRRAWYCCEGCQQAAWAGHMEVCRSSS
jgi:hypothetical protein